MTADRPVNDSASLRTCSRVSNGSQTLLFGDGRSAGARRYRDLLTAFSRDLGEPLSATADQVVRRLAGVSVELELMEAERAAGNMIGPVAFCTLVNSQRRLLRDLDRLKAHTAPRQPTLAETLAAERRAREAAQPAEAA